MGKYTPQICDLEWIYPHLKSDAYIFFLSSRQIAHIYPFC